MAFLSGRILLQKLGKCVCSDLIGEGSKRSIQRWVLPTILEINRRAAKSKKLPEDRNKRSNYIEWSYNAEIYAFGKRLSEDFNIELLLQAFINRSYIVKEELKQQQVGIDSPNLELKDNESLAVEGKKIISEYLDAYLSQTLPRFPLEAVIAIRNHLLEEKTLADLSKNLGTNDIIMTAESPVEDHTFAKTFLAIVGALARSQSVDRANLFVRDFVAARLAEMDVTELFMIDDPLKVLTEILARDGKDAPEPRLIGQSSMNDILATYTVGIYSDKQLIGQGPGETVDTAVEIAARDSLRRLFHGVDSSSPLKIKNVNIFNSKPGNLRISEWRQSAFER